MSQLSHFDEDGASRMVDVGAKQATDRRARASATVRMRPETLRHIRESTIAKGDVFEVARLAGIMAAKRTSELIPLCHPLGLDTVSVGFSIPEGDGEPCTVVIETEARVHAKTGVEMEALTAASVAALTIYDMCKSIDRGMTIESVRLLEKTGGKSGRYLAETTDPDEKADS